MATLLDMQKLVEDAGQSLDRVGKTMQLCGEVALLAGSDAAKVQDYEDLGRSLDHIVDHCVKVVHSLEGIRLAKQGDLTNGVQ